MIYINFIDFLLIFLTKNGLYFKAKTFDFVTYIYGACIFIFLFLNSICNVKYFTYSIYMC